MQYYISKTIQPAVTRRLCNLEQVLFMLRNLWMRRMFIAYTRNTQSPHTNPEFAQGWSISHTLKYCSRNCHGFATLISVLLLLRFNSTKTRVSSSFTARKFVFVIVKNENFILQKSNNAIFFFFYSTGPSSDHVE